MERELTTGAVVRWTLACAGAWAVMSLAGFAAVGAVVAALIGDPDEVLEGPVRFGLALGAVFALAGAAMGAVQTVFLRHRGMRGARRWILGSAVGFGAVGLLYALLEPVVPVLVNELLHNLVAGALAGAVQARVIDHLAGRASARRWAAITGLAYLSGGAVTAAVARGAGVDEGTAGLLGVVAVAAVLGLGLRDLLARASRGEASAARALAA